MSKRIILAGITTLLLIFSSCAKKNPANTYFTDINDGLKNAKELNQNILLCVTMPSSDQYSQNFMSKVFMTESFQNEIMTDYTVVLFDFSQNAYQLTMVTEGMSDAQVEMANKQFELMRRNFEVANDLNIKVTPAIVLLTKDKYFISELDYKADKASYTSFKFALDKQKDRIKKVNSLVDDIKVSTGIHRANAIDALYNDTAMERRGLLKDLVKEFISIDKDNQTGLVNKYLMAQAETQSLELFSSGKVEDAANAYISICDNPYMQPADIQQAYYLAAMILGYSGNQDYERILDLLNKSVQAYPEGENNVQIQAVIDSINTVANVE